MKVFSAKKYLLDLIKRQGDDIKELKKRLDSQWYIICNGLNEEEMLELGYVTSDDWMEEK